jgi:protein TonB
MLISKFDLYKPEWLELVFDNRNKAYGAYELRQHYARNMVLAMSATFLGIGLLFGAGAIFSHQHIAPVVQLPNDHIVPVTITEIKPPVAPPKAIDLPKPVSPPKTTAFMPPVVVDDHLVTTPPPDVTHFVGAVGTVTTPGTNNNTDVPIVVDVPAGGGSAVPTVDNSVHNTIGLESMPEPIGGDKAWSKFLNKNLRFPAVAQEEGQSGRVYMSFIIEKDGTLTNITVERAAGNGFDEEATRVLKLAKAWKPGIQNGQPVRVKFIIPINFTIADQQ